MPRWTVCYNVPGYLPESDPETFDEFESAVDYARELLDRESEDLAEDATSRDLTILRKVSAQIDRLKDIAANHVERDGGYVTDQLPSGYLIEISQSEES